MIFNIMDNKNVLYKNAKKSNNASIYLRENSKLDKSKIIEMSYDIQSGNYTNLEENKYFCDVYEYFSNKICKFINQIDLTNYSILEIGCGEGNLFYRICKNLDNKYSKSFGLDISISRLMYSKKICEAHKISNYSLMACDMNNFPLEDNLINFLVTSLLINDKSSEPSIVTTTVISNVSETTTSGFVGSTCESVSNKNVVQSCN